MAAPAKLVDGVHRLGTSLVNWYVVEDEGRLTVVDAGLPAYRPQLDEALSALGLGLGDLEAVILTHAHGDHMGVAEALRTEAGVPVHVHEADENLARTGKQPKRERSLLPYLRHPHALKLMGHLVRAGVMKTPQLGEVSTFADGAVLDVPGRPRAIHAPGHTAGCVVFHFERHGALLAGDVLCELNPLTGRRGPQVPPGAFNDSSAQALESLGRIESIDAPLVAFGHGEPWREGVAAAVARAHAAGPS